MKFQEFKLRLCCGVFTVFCLLCCAFGAQAETYKLSASERALYRCVLNNKKKLYEVGKLRNRAYVSFSMRRETRSLQSQLKRYQLSGTSSTAKRSAAKVSLLIARLQKIGTSCAAKNGVRTGFEVPTQIPTATATTGSNDDSPLPVPTVTSTQTPQTTTIPGATPTRTPSGTSVPVVSATPTRTPTRTNTPALSATPTRTPTRTPTPTVTPIRTATPTPTVTRTPTATPVVVGDPRLNSVLIVYNRNAADSEDIARYYAAARGINTNRLCGVYMPPGHYASKDQLLGARRTIVEQCICPLIPTAQRPAPCDITKVDQLSTVSPITHLAIIRGVPGRFNGTTWSTDYQDPSIDIYLSHLLYKPASQVIDTPSGYTSTLTGYNGWSATSPMMIQREPIGAAQHKQVAFGRIDGLSKNSTLSLIERTLDAEESGVKGNVLWNLNDGQAAVQDDDPLGNFLRDLSGSQQPLCKSYLPAATPWPYAQCRAGGQANGRVPGEGNTIPRAINAGLYLGQNPFPNGQNGFNGSFTTMKHWHKSAYDCTELCSALPTSTEISHCRANSTDYYKELNTSCVGVAPGFVGHQVRSFPVQDYGVYPPGWFTTTAGAYEKLAPQLMEIAGNAFNDATYTDNRFLRFGGHKNTASPTCVLENGTSQACPERVAFWLERSNSVPAGHNLATQRYVVRFRHRNPANANGRFLFSVAFSSPASGCYRTVTTAVALTTAATNWVTEELRFPGIANMPPSDPTTCTDPTNLAVSSINLGLVAQFTDNLYDYFDLDAVELVEENSGERMFPVTIGSFSAPYVDNLTNGDWAANVMDRLGGIAWWGSNSHHLTGGWAFSDSDNFAGAFFSGRTLAESVLLMGSPESGMFFGDPLYSPSAVKIYLENDTQGIYRTYSGPVETNYQMYSIYNTQASSYQRNLRLNILHGRANTATTRWELSRCLGKTTPAACDAANSWSVFSQGTGAQIARLQTSDLRTLVVDRTLSQNVYLKLRVWNPGEESSALYNLAYMHYFP